MASSWWLLVLSAFAVLLISGAGMIWRHYGFKQSICFLVLILFPFASFEGCRRYHSVNVQRRLVACVFGSRQCVVTTSTIIELPPKAVFIVAPTGELRDSSTTKRYGEIDMLSTDALILQLPHIGINLKREADQPQLFRSVSGNLYQIEILIQQSQFPASGNERCRKGR
jgi:hypothetical protein